MSDPLKPPTRRQAFVSRANQINFQGRLAQLKPERLSIIRNAAERGDVSDWVDLCYRIVATDSHARADYETRLSAVAGSRFVIEPGIGSGLPDRDDQLAAELVSRALAKIIDLPQVFIELLDAIGVGFATQEIIWDYDAEMSAHLPKDLEWVYQARFKFAEDWTLRLKDLNGFGGSAAGEPLIPNKWIVHQSKTVAGYPSMTGCMLPVSWAYIFKRWSMQAWVLMAERLGSPLIVGKVPRNADASVREALREGLENLSSDHAAVLEDSSAIEIIDAGIRDGATHKDLVDAMNREISKAILGLSGTTEQGGVGSYAAIEARQGATVDARKLLDATSLGATLKRDLFTPIVRFNRHLFSKDPAIPSIRWVLGNENAALATATPEILSLSKTTVNELRAALDLDPVSREIGDLVVGTGPVDEEVGVTEVMPAEGGVASVADTALNGAQVASLLEIISIYNAGGITAEQARVALAKAFPTIDAASAQRLIPDSKPGTQQGSPDPSQSPTGPTAPSAPNNQAS